VYSEFYGKEPVEEYKRLERYVDYIKENTDVNIIYPLDELVYMKPYLDVYSKFDTHWNNVGGFVGYQALLKSIGLPTTSVFDWPIYEYAGGNALAEDHYFRQVKGDLLGLGGLNQSLYPIHISYYIKYRTHVNFTFVDGTAGKNGAGDIRHTVADNATFDMNLVMLGDSFRVMQLSYIEKDFSDAYLCHRNQVNDSLTQEALKNADIIVIAATERFDSNIIDTARQLIHILSQN
jgi:hypothetical protein